MRHVIFSTSRDGREITLQVKDNAVDNGLPREMRITQVDKLTIMDRRNTEEEQCSSDSAGN